MTRSSFAALVSSLTIALTSPSVATQAATQNEEQRRPTLSADSEQVAPGDFVVLTGSGVFPRRWEKSGGSWCRTPMCDWRSFGACVQPSASSAVAEVYWVSEDPGTFTISLRDATGRRARVQITVTDNP